MTNTEGLDALAALCGSTISAPTTEENAKVGGDVVPVQNNDAQQQEQEEQQHQQPPAIPTNTNTQIQASQNQTNLVQQQQQQMQQVSQLQQVQLLLARQAAVAQAQQQQQQQQVQQQFNPQLVQQLQSLLASQQVDNNNAIQVQAQHALQAIAAQQQQQQLSAVALASLAASGGQVLPTGATLSSDLTTLPQVTTTFDLQQQMKMPSPSTLAMPPPPSKLVPSLTLSGNTKKSKKKKGSSPPPIEDIITEWEDKKQAKRAANRLSAHLSRKRKKMFIEELKEENVELRRKELILRSIPDLIVVFDSSGCISFVSHSVTRFLDYKVEELENTSFWEHLTEESMRLIKSAFMDALAIKRNPNQDSTPLANGESMAVTLLHKNNGGGETPQGLKVTLKGVVHFSTDSPECVCSIRPESTSRNEANKKMKPVIKESSSVAAAAQNQQEKVAALADGSVAPTHQVSDIDSEKS